MILYIKLGGNFFSLRFESKNNQKLGIFVWIRIASFLPSINIEGFSFVRGHLKAIPFPKEKHMMENYLHHLEVIKDGAKEGAIVSTIGKLKPLRRVEQRKNSYELHKEYNVRLLIENRDRSGYWQNEYDKLFGITVREPGGGDYLGKFFLVRDHQ